MRVTDSHHSLVARPPFIVWQDGDTNPAGGIVVFTTSTPDGLFSSTQTIGVNKPSESLTVLGGNGGWTTTTTNPDGTSMIQTHTGGLLSLVEHKSGAPVSLIASTVYEYDGLKRPWKQTDSRTGTTTTAYISTTADFVASVTDAATPARVTKFKYDTRGRRVEVDAPNTLDADGNSLVNTTITHYGPANHFMPHRNCDGTEVGRNDGGFRK